MIHATTRRLLAVLLWTVIVAELRRCVPVREHPAQRGPERRGLDQCEPAATIVAVRKEYGLTIDRREAAALDRILAGCDSFELVTPEPST